MTEAERKNWDYLLAAISNPQGSYVNARATRYANAILAADRLVKRIDVVPTPTVRA